MKTMNRNRWKWIGIAVVAAAAAFYFIFSLSGRTTPSVERGKKKQSAFLNQKGAKSAVKSLESLQAGERPAMNKKGLRRRIGGGEDDIFRDEDGKPYPAKDQEVMRRARAAIDNDDLEAARALVAEALSSKNDELRSMVVEALAWFGKDSLVELTQFMADANEEVAEAAKDGWMGGLQEIDDDGVKAGVVEVTLKSLRDSEMLEDVANELVGIDELAALQVLVNILDEGKNAAAIPAAKEAYNTITGEDWKDVDAAEAWLQQNYELDDDDK